jgi:hypothetical protein
MSDDGLLFDEAPRRTGPTIVPDNVVISMTALRWDDYKRRLSPSELKRLSLLRSKAKQEAKYGKDFRGGQDYLHEKAGRALASAASYIGDSPFTQVLLAASAFTPLAPFALAAATGIAAAKTTGQALTGDLTVESALGTGAQLLGQAVPIPSQVVTAAKYGRQAVKAGQQVARGDYVGALQTGVSTASSAGVRLPGVQVPSVKIPAQAVQAVKVGTAVARGDYRSAASAAGVRVPGVQFPAQAVQAVKVGTAVARGDYRSAASAAGVRVPGVPLAQAVQARKMAVQAQAQAAQAAFRGRLGR